MVYDFHCHTFLSDGELSPVELVRRAMVRGYRAIALTDHAGLGTLELVLRQLIADCELVMRYWDIIAIPGVELTHVPARAVDELARRAHEAGARIVNVHGETPVEPTEPGTNAAAVRSAYVNLLVHPGLITLEDARAAAERGIFLEISARRGHSLANGHVARVARAAGAQLLVNSDEHAPGDLLSADFARTVALGAGLEPAEATSVLEENPLKLLRRLGHE